MASVLMVSHSEKITEYFKELLQGQKFQPVFVVTNAMEARRFMVDNPADIVVINTPLPDDTGISLAIDLAEGGMSGVLLLVKNELLDQVSFRVEDYGVLTVGRPTSRQMLYQALKLLLATRARLAAMNLNIQSLEEKMKEIRLVDRAKCILIAQMQMSESEAHRYIEKSAMDRCVKRREIAENIIRTYEN